MGEQTQAQIWREDCWVRISSWFREYVSQRKQALKVGDTLEEEIKQQERMRILLKMIKKIKKVGMIDTKSSWWVTGLLASDRDRNCLNIG